MKKKTKQKAHNKAKPTNKTNSKYVSMIHSAKWCIVTFLTFKTAPVTPYLLQDVAEEMLTRLVTLSPLLGKNIGSFEKRQEPGTPHDTESWKINASKILSTNRAKYITSILI